jgi:hypothetical protein
MLRPVFGGYGTCKGFSPNELFNLCSRYLDNKRIFVVKGWFKDTVAQTLKSPLALIHIDSDLYESAIDCLDPLFHHQLVSSGAIIYFDDYNCNRSDPSFGERKAWSDLVAKYNIFYSDQCSYGIAGHSYIVHSYVHS